jgi:hypothetical protein
MYKNTNTWAIGLMICQMEKVNKFGAMVLTIKETFLTVKNMEKVNINFLMDALTKALSSETNLMVKVIYPFLKENTKDNFKRADFMEKDCLNGKMVLRMKVIIKRIRKTVLVNT